MARNKVKAATAKTATVATPSSPVKQAKSRATSTATARVPSSSSSRGMPTSTSVQSFDESMVATPTGRRSPVDGGEGEGAGAGDESIISALDDSMAESDADAGSASPTASASPAHVVVCVRMRPAPDASSSSEQPWSVDARTNTVEATDSHPSIAKRGGSSSAPPLPSSASSSMPTSASSSFLADQSSTNLAATASETYKFKFDRLVPPQVTSLDELYTSNLSPVVNGAVQGYNGTVFAYGQTGSGKTYTMSGGGGEQGIISRAIDEVFRCVEEIPDREFLLRVSYLEIYNESLRDLLVSLPSSSGSGASGTNANANARPASPTKGGYSHSAAGTSSTASSSLRIMEHPSSGRVSIAGLREEIVTQPSQVMDLLTKGQAARHQAATDWNERSSRSHCVATLTIESRWKEDPSGPVRVSALNLIDLAGSERAASSHERRKEGAFINKSLLTLGSVISKLSLAAASGATSAQQHIPYRDSKLTRLLQTSLSGNARVAVLLTMSPLTRHAVEGLSTLKFGKRCKMIKLKAKRGEVDEGEGGANEALLRKYRREVERLRARLEESAASSASSAATAATAGGAVDTDSSTPAAAVDTSTRSPPPADLLAAQAEVDAMNKQKAELRKQMEHLTRLIVTSTSLREGRQNSRESDDSFPSSSSASLLTSAPPGTPTRRMGRASEYGTPGTPTRNPNARLLERAIRGGSGGPSSSSSSTLRSTSGSADGDAVDTAASGAGAATARPFALEAQLASLRKSLAAAESARADAERERENDQTASDERVAVLLEQHVQRISKMESEHGEVVKAKERAVEALQLKVREAEASLQQGQEGLRGELQSAYDELTTLRGELATNGESLEAVRAELKAANDGLAAVRAELTAANEGLAAVRSELEAANEALAAVRAELTTANSALTTERASSATNNDALAAARSELDNERTARLAAEATLAKRPETEEEVTQREFDDLVRPARDAEQAKGGKAAATTVMSTSSSGSANDSDDTAARVKALEERERKLAEREQQLQTQSQSHSPPHHDVSALQDKVAQLTAQLDEAKSASSSSKGPGGAAVSRLSRGGSLREYRRYAPATSTDAVPSSPTHSRLMGGLGLAMPKPTSDALAIEAAVRNEREEIQRLNDVIASQRSLMTDLEASVGEWKDRMRNQQDIIRRLLLNGGNDDGDGDGDGGDRSAYAAALLAATATPSSRGIPRTTKLPTPPLQDGEDDQDQNKQPEYAVNMTPTRRGGGGLPLRSSVGRRSNGGGGDAQGQFDFAKRRSAFLQGSGPSDGKPRGGSVFTATTSTNSSNNSPYYGAHMYNRPPPAKGSLNAGLGLTAPNSPTKGGGLWGSSSATPDPLPLPAGATSSPTGTPSRNRAKRRITIEHELEKLKNGSSPRVDERTRGLLHDSPLKKSTVARMGSVGPDESAAGNKSQSRDWYI